MASIKVRLTRNDKIIYEDSFIGPTPTIAFLLYEPMDLYEMYSPFHNSDIIKLTKEQIIKGKTNYKKLLENNESYSGTFYGNIINYGELDQGLLTQIFMDTTPEYLVYLQRKLDKLYDVLMDFSDNVEIQFLSL